MKGLGKSISVGMAAALLAAVLVLWYTLRPLPLTVQIYYPDRNALFLVPVTRVIQELTPAALLVELETPPQDPALTAVFPREEPPVFLKTRARTLTVDFQKPPSLDKWPLLIQSFLATFKQLPGYEWVEFTVRGEPGVVSGGEELGKESLRGFWVNDNLEASSPAVRTTEAARKVVAYYRLKGTGLLVPVTLRISSKVEAEEGIAQAWEESSALSWALESPLPSGSRIRSAERMADNVVEVTVELAGSGPDQELARKAVILTYTELPGVRRVRVREHRGLVNWSLLKKRPLFINAEEENR